MLNELGHFLERSFTKGSKQEIDTIKNEDRLDNIKHPKYIIYIICPKIIVLLF